MKKHKRENCTSMIDAVITDIRVKGLEAPTMITVQFTIDQVDYQICESIKLKSKMIKIGFLPIGQKKIPVLPNPVIGGYVKVNYNPENPKEAYIRDNIGIMSY